MLKIWTSFKMNKNKIIFFTAFSLIAFICGILYFNKVNDTIVVNLNLDLININFSSNILYHIIFVAVIMFFSFCIAGSIIGLFLYFYEILSIGFIFSLFSSSYGISGIIYIIIFIILYKTVYIFCLSKIVINSLYLSKHILGYFLLKKDEDLKKSVLTTFSTIIKYSIVLFLYDLFLIICGNYILDIFDFLI